jgi:predicted ATPase/DNA-binding CsgD family transcriptional regulator
MPRPEADAKGRRSYPVTSLPTPTNRLIGRDAEVAWVCQLLRDNRLVTLTGPPGVGKTRLALEVAAAVAPEFAEGLAFVDLARIRDAALVLPEVAHSLGIGDAPGAGPADRLATALMDREILLVIDNLEHVLDAALELAHVVSACPRLRVLATTRQRLRLNAERECAVSPLPLPDVADRADPERLSATASVALLLERARSPDFRVTRHNAGAIAEICVRLDGLPLAIELAAARLDVFSPKELVNRLENRMTLLSDGPHDMASRHRALRTAIEWSHDLLPHRERTLFRRLSVFAGGWTLSAAEQICAAPDLDILGGLGSLLDKNLILRTTRADGRAGFSMLESIREFAVEQLERHDDAATVRARHAVYYADGTRSIRVAATGAGEAASYAWMGEEHGNLRGALADRRAAGDLEHALVLASALGWYWYTRGYFGEGKATLDGLLSAADETAVSDATLINALVSLGFSASARGDLDDAEQALTTARALAERTGDRPSTATSSLCLGHVARGHGRYDEAAALYSDAARMFAELGHDQGVTWAQQDLAMLAAERGDLAKAERLMRESLRRSRSIDYSWAQAWAAWGLGTVLLRRGAVDEASMLLGEALTMYNTLDDRRGVAQCLEAFAAVAAMRASYHSAARLLGAAGMLRQALGATVPADERHRLGKVEATIAQAIGPDAAERARYSGRSMTAAAAIELAKSYAAPATASASTVELTAREREVAVLIAAGSTNRQIGRALGITEKTAEVHVRNIMGKLRVASRAGVASWAVANGLHRPAV